MSQITSSGGGVIPPGAAVQTLTGNIGGPAVPDGANNIDLLGVGNLQVSLTGPSELSITDLNNVQYTVQTLDATPTVIHLVPIAPSSAVTVTATIVGARDDFSAAAWGEVIFGARRPAVGAAAAVQIPTVTAIGSDGAVAPLTADVVGNNLRILVTGVVAQTWDWTATVIVLEQT